MWTSKHKRSRCRNIKTQYSLQKVFHTVDLVVQKNQTHIPCLSIFDGTIVLLLLLCKLPSARNRRLLKLPNEKPRIMLRHPENSNICGFASCLSAKDKTNNLFCLIGRCLITAIIICRLPRIHFVSVNLPNMGKAINFRSEFGKYKPCEFSRSLVGSNRFPLTEGNQQSLRFS